MKRPLFLLPILILSAAAPAGAQEKPPSMVGTWLVTGTAVGIGDSFHPNHSNDGSQPSVHPVTLRFVIEKQEANNFWGTSTGPSGTSERILGAISADGKLGVLVNARGNQQQFRFIDASTVEGCYASHSPSYLSAACTMWHRQP